MQLRTAGHQEMYTPTPTPTWRNIQVQMLSIAYEGLHFVLRIQTVRNWIF